jgi:hypothetical protein
MRITKQVRVKKKNATPYSKGETNRNTR